MDFTGYLFWGGLVLALSAGMLLAVTSLIAKVQAPLKSVRLGKNLSIGASMLAGVIILSAGLVAATRSCRMRRLPRKNRTGFNRTGRPGKERHLSAGGTRSPSSPWPTNGPTPRRKSANSNSNRRTGNTLRKQPNDTTSHPISSRRYAPSSRGMTQTPNRGGEVASASCNCIKDTARKYGVNPHKPRENIMGGTAVLANLMGRYNGDIHSVLHKYNAACTPAYEREVIRAYNQAKQFAMVSLEEKGH